MRNYGNVSISPPLTVDTSAYTAGDIVGGILTLSGVTRAGGVGGTLQALSVYDADNAKAGFTVLLFNATPAGGTYADQGAPVWHANDQAKFIGSVTVATGDYVTAGGDAFACLKNLNLPVVASGSANLFAVVIATATPTYTAGTDLRLVFAFDRN